MKFVHDPKFISAIAFIAVSLTAAAQVPSRQLDAPQARSVLNAVETQGSGSIPATAVAQYRNNYNIAMEPAGLQPQPGPQAASGPFASSGFESAGIHVNLNSLFAAMNRPTTQSAGEDEEEAPGPYSVKGLLWQSLAFTGIEDGFRLGTDHYMRHLVADGPFWHDYFASLGQWHMNRWSDGDDFLVDDIGHPMQGAVSAYIEIQNSPRQRVLEISKTRAYWRSRFLAMMWATVFSTQQKIGPLGEAAVGNDGGYTYIPGCEFSCKYVPGKTKYTNNTGWTDFIMTPVGGTAWVVMEDFLDREISDRVAFRYPDSVFPKILRASLNPTRSMANFLRWRTPWYRDYRHYTGNQHISPGIHFIRTDRAAALSAPRFELFPHFNAISLPVNTATCTGCRRMTSGFGMDFAARMTRWVDFDSDVDYLPNASPMPSDRAGGSAVMGTFGLRTGLQYSRYAVKVALRPGFLTYSHAYESTPTPGGPTPDTGRITHFVTALAINADYDLSRHFALRTVLGNTPVRYRDSYTTNKTGAGTAPFFNWLSHQIFLTNENWDYQTGVVLRF